MRAVTKYFVLIASLALSGLLLSSCSARTVQETVKEHRIIVRPGKRLAPRSLETYDGGKTQNLEGYHPPGTTYMFIIRGLI